MFEFGVYVLCAFLLFVVLLPLMGAIVGIVAYMGLPYLAGVAFTCAAHKIFHGSYFDLGAFWILALIWVVLLVYVRQVCKKALELESTWHEGHYLAASTILLMGHPYRKIKKAATA